MAKMKLKQLRDADVRYISLVDRAATRIPFRVLKREKENMMGIDLTKVFKSENAEKPYVSALVVFAQKDEAAASQVTDAIRAHGFSVNRVQKSDNGETLVYAQTDQPKDITIVRLSDQVLVNVANLQTPSGWVGEMVKEHGFFPDLKTATAAMYEQVVAVSKAEDPQEEAKAALTSYGEYLSQMVVLPVNCYKLDDAITELVTKGKKKPAEGSAEEEATESAEEEKVEDAKKNETEEERKKRIADHPPAEMAPADEDDDQKGPPEDVMKGEKPAKKVEAKPEVVKKDDPILTMLKGIETTVKGLATKLDEVATEQTSQKKVLDGVVQKTDTLDTTLKATVTAVPQPEDRPGPVRMRVEKDDDPRRGNFDTAFLRRRR
jgi:hypothetical protein